MMKKRGLFLIFSIGLLLRMGYILVFPQEKVLRGDAAQYDIIAHNLVSGFGFSINPNVPTPTRAPIYPLFLSFIYFIFGHNYTVVRFFQVILSGLTCVILYYIAKEIFNEKIATISAWLLVSYPVLIVYTGLLLTETLFTFLLAVSVLLLIRGIVTAKTKYFIGSGTFLGLATLTRPVTLLFPFVILIFFIIVKRKLILNWFAFFLIFVVVLFPWVLRNYKLFGMYNICSIGTGYGIFVTGNMAKGYTFEESFQKYVEFAKGFPEPKVFIPKQCPDVERERKSQAEGLKLIKENLKNYFIIVLKRLPRFWWTSHSSIFGVDKPISEYLREKNYLYPAIRFSLLGLHGIVLMLALVGIIVSIKSWQNTLILVLILIYFTGHILFDMVPRYHLPATPYLFAFTSVGLYSFVGLFKKAK
jgi:4-amino-4-deoxy-L-arabinose transferase-like glycosyltransferase